MSQTSLSDWRLAQMYRQKELKNKLKKKKTNVPASTAGTSLSQEAAQISHPGAGFDLETVMDTLEKEKEQQVEEGKRSEKEVKWRMKMTLMMMSTCELAGTE